MIYLDNNATTRIDNEVREAMLPYLMEEYGNYGSRFYSLGNNAKKAVETARNQVASLINCKPEEIIFTSSGSEANNFVIKGMSDYLKNYRKKGNHIVTSKVEHKSIINSFKFLDGQLFMNKEIKESLNNQEIKIDRGFDVEFLDVNKLGQVELDKISECIGDKTILVSLIYANNETGNLNDIASISKLLKEKGVFFHSDMTQAVGKIPVDLSNLDIDSITLSGHKIYGPKGASALFLRKDKYSSKNISSLIHGGSDQENGYRAGTLPIHDIVGFGKAAEIAKRDLKENMSRILNMEKELITILKRKYPDIILLSAEEKIPGTVSFILPDINNQLYLKIKAKDIALSSGSACTIANDSSILSAMGLEYYSNNFLRIGIGKNNTLDEIRKLEELL